MLLQPSLHSAAGVVSLISWHLVQATQKAKYQHPCLAWVSTS